MLDTQKLDHSINYKYISFALIFSIIFCLSAMAQAEPPAGSPGKTETFTESATESAAGDANSVEALRDHAATIGDMLKAASDRVEHLAAEGDPTPELLDAIRQELSLSRRWNEHLGSILSEVVEARRLLGERERAAAREIARMTAVAEEARQELAALKDVLRRRPAAPTETMEKRSEGRVHIDDVRDTAVAMVARRLVGSEDLKEAEETLLAMREAQTSAIRDVDAVRSRIVDALTTIVATHGDLPVDGSGTDRELSSMDITSWAASMAARLKSKPVE